MSKLRTLELVSAIHEQVRRKAESRDPATCLEEWSNDLASLSSVYSDVYTSRNLVGRTPQMPSLLIAKVAGVVIWIMQKLLFWHTPQIRRFQHSSATAIGRLRSLAERDYEAHLALDRRLGALENEVRSVSSVMRATSGSSAPEPSDEVNADAELFCFALQRRFQFSARHDTVRQQNYLSLISTLKPPSGVWLDIGCGAGEWIALLRKGDYEAVGIDSSEEAITACKQKGLTVRQADALAYLSDTPSERLAAVTAFHVFEHWPFEYTLALVRQAVRALAPDGLLIVETPNPANILMASEQFWMDPTHRRPLPLPLMEFLLEYCGLRVEHRLELSPRPEEEHLPFRELELSARLDRLLYGPQDYAIVARKDGPL